MLQVVWFKRDLRIHDHRPLAEAARRGPVLPLYLVEDEVLRAPDYSRRHWDFTRAALKDLRESLHALGQPLIVRPGPAVEALELIRRNHGIAHLWAHEETGNAATYVRDRAVRRWARESAVPFTEFPSNGIVRRLPHRDGWSKIWEARMAEPQAPAPSCLQPLPKIEAGLIPPASALVASTRSDATNTLESFLHARGLHYSRELSSPLTAEASCSRLSSFLAYGLLSMREVVQATRERIARLREERTPEAKAWLRSLRAFDARLHWHCHFIQKLEDEPQVEHENFVRAFDGLRESEFNREFFDAWKEGRTGYPFVDACMRYLRQTGWINFRMRAMLVSFASYHLWLHWREPAIHLARLFTDYEPGIHYSQFQMQSGTTGINTLRIYSPAKQAEDQDPDGKFVRIWVPEANTPRYPKPIVDHAEAVRAARAKIAAYRKLPALRAQLSEVMEKHGSRKRPPPKRKPKSKTNPGPDTQQSLF